MNLKIYTVRDHKAECYLPPFTMRTNAEAIRSFADSVVKPGPTIHDHPEDFALYLVGEFDQISCKLVPCEMVSLANAVDFKELENNG